MSLRLICVLCVSCAVASCSSEGVFVDRSVEGDGGSSDSSSYGSGDVRSSGERSVGADLGAGYSEPVCDPLGDLSQVESTYSSTEVRAALVRISQVRYPIGVAFVEGLTDANLRSFVPDSSTFKKVVFYYEVAAHEGCHLWGFHNSSGPTYAYRVRDDLVIKTRRLNNFPRSEILAAHANPAADSYADTYLKQSGNQGFNTLLDEYNAYTHSLAMRYCTRDGLAASQHTSARDGILTMMYYVELYLKVARTAHPADYAAILADPEHVKLILTTWQRAQFWLKRTETQPQLGINDKSIRAWTFDPDNTKEIDLLSKK